MISFKSNGRPLARPFFSENLKRSSRIAIPPKKPIGVFPHKFRPGIADFPNDRVDDRFRRTCLDPASGAILCLTEILFFEKLIGLYTKPFHALTP
jgi:hypothetical protein